MFNIKPIKIYKDYKNFKWHILDNDTKNFFVLPFGQLSTDFFNNLKYLGSPYKDYKKYTSYIQDYYKFIKETSTRICFSLEDFYTITTAKELNISAMRTIDSTRIYYNNLFKNTKQLPSLQQTDFISLVYKAPYNKQSYNYVRALTYLLQLLKPSPATGIYGNLPEDTNSVFPYELQFEEGFPEEFLSYLDNTTSENVTYKGYDSILISDKNILCEKYLVTDLFFLIPEDYFTFLSLDNGMLKICSECEARFVATHKGQKLCKSCKYHNDTHREDMRKKQIRYKHNLLHKSYKKISTEDDNKAEQFRIESNYYWDIARYKKSKIPKQLYYKDDISTEDDYKAWLNLKEKELVSLLTDTQKEAYTESLLQTLTALEHKETL